jgi:hypothetical protein
MYSMILQKKTEISEESKTCQPLFSLTQKAQRKPTSQGSVTKKKRRGNFRPLQSARRAPRPPHISAYAEIGRLLKKSGQKLSC